MFIILFVDNLFINNYFLKKVIIAGSWSLREKSLEWKQWWEDRWYTVLNYPKNLEWEDIYKKYKDLYVNFFKDLVQVDIFFLMNEDKKWIEGYIWMESFAELWFATVQKTVNDKTIDILFLKMPSKEIWCYDEMNIWQKLWWIEQLDESKFVKNT